MKCRLTRVFVGEHPPEGSDLAPDTLPCLKYRASPVSDAVRASSVKATPICSDSDRAISSIVRMGQVGTANQ